MIKSTQYKWLVVAICFSLGKPSGFGKDSWLQQWINNLPGVKEARQNCDGYSQKINWSTTEVNKQVDQLDSGRDESAQNTYNSDHNQAVADLQKGLAVRWNTQKNINILLPQAQQYRDAAVKYAAAHPGDKAAQADAQEALNAYTKLVKWGNNNGTNIYHATDQLRGQDPGTKYPNAPNVIDPASIPVVPNKPPKASADQPHPSELEVQQLKDAKPRPSDLELKDLKGGNTSNPDYPPDDGFVDQFGNKPPHHDPPTNDLDKSRDTRDNIDYLINLAQQLKDQNAKKAEANKDDPWAAGAVADAQHQIDELQAMRDRINDRITGDLVQKLVPDDKKSADNTQNAPASGGADDSTQKSTDSKKSANNAQSDDPSGMGLLNVMGLPNSLGGVVMAPDQGDQATQKFIDSLDGNSPGVDVRPSNQLADTARDNVKDGIRDATRDAANTARDNARGSIDHCPPRGGCH